MATRAWWRKPDAGTRPGRSSGSTLRRSWTRATKVVLLYRQVGRGRWSGVEVEERAGWVYTLREGKVIRLEMLPDQATALRAASLER